MYSYILTIVYCEICSIAVSTQICSNRHIVLSIVEQHQLNTRSCIMASVKWFWNNGDAVGLTVIVLRPLQGGWEIITSKVDHIRPKDNLRSIGKVCIFVIRIFRLELKWLKVTQIITLYTCPKAPKIDILRLYMYTNQNFP